MSVTVAGGTGLRISRELALPVEYVTQTCAILAQRRKGKTYAAAVIAEELYAAGLPWVALDPTGAWWGLRSSADGEEAGLPVVVIGGQHGDLPLDAYAGGAVADLVLDHPGWYVIDLSLLEGRPAERQFATDFGSRLHRRKMQPGMDFPLHLFVDEADMFVPQEKETKGDVPLLAAYQGIVRRGGLHGLGTTLISQRPALVNKSVLTQLDLLVLLRLVAGQDQDAVDKSYVSRFLDKDRRGDVMGSLATMPVGTAWFLEPGQDPPLAVRLQVRERHTFNSSATPKAGEHRVEPRVFAQIDLDALAAQMADSVERAKADDPAELRREIRDLKRQLDTRPAETVVETVTETVTAEVPAFTDEERQLLDQTFEALVVSNEQSGRLLGNLDIIKTRIDNALAERTLEEGVTVKPRPTPSMDAQASSTHRDRRLSSVSPSSNGRTSAPQQRILDALAWFEAIGVEAPRRPPLAAVAGVSSKSSGFRANVSTLSGSGYVVYPPGGRVALTQSGRAAATPPAVMPTREALHEAIYAMVSGPQGEILAELIRAYPNPVNRDDLAHAAGVSPTSSGFRANVSTLSGFELISYPSPGTVVALEVLFP